MSIRPLIETLETSFDKLAKQLFSKEELPSPVITLQTHGRRNAYGWFARDMWIKGKDETLPEINISAEYLNRGVFEVIETLVHEMVHYVNHLRFSRGDNKKRDCNSSQYHNKIFKKTCEEIGLNCEKMGRYGWADTSLTKELKTKIEELKLNTEAFFLARRMSSVSKQPTKMKKWSCQCGINIRAAVSLDIRCNACGYDFEKN